MGMKANTYDIVTQTLKELTAPYGVFKTSWYYVFKGAELLRYRTYSCISTPYVEYSGELKSLSINDRDYKIGADCICDNLNKHIYLLATHKWRCWE